MVCLFYAFSCIHNLKMIGVTAAANHIGAKEFPLQSNNCRRSLHTWHWYLTVLKQICCQSICIEGKITPEFKDDNNHRMPSLGWNPSGNYKWKSLVVYHTKSMGTEGMHEIKLPVVWKGNEKGWITSTIFKRAGCKRNLRHTVREEHSFQISCFA